MTDWESVKREFISSNVSLRELARKYALNYSSLQKHSANGKWTEERRRAGGEESKRRMEQVTAKLLWRMEKTIDGNQDMDSKDIKAMTGALKELKEIQRQDDPEKGERGDGLLEVRFMGDTEELSK